VKQTSPETGASLSVIPATASRGLAPVGGAGDLQTAAVAGSPGPAAPSTDATGATPRLASSFEAVSVAEAGTRSAIPAPQRVETPHLHQLPKRRELSYPLAALAYTWAAIERRTR